MLWNWFGFGRNPGEPRDRLLFPYRDGTRVRRADPIRVENALIQNLGFDWTAVVADLSKPYPPGILGDTMDAARAQRAAQRDKVLAAIDAAFEVHDYIDKDPETGKPSGLGALERFGLIEGFSRFCNVVLEASRPFENVRSRDAPIPENPPAPNGSAFISGVSESSVQGIAT